MYSICIMNAQYKFYKTEKHYEENLIIQTICLVFLYIVLALDLILFLVSVLLIPFKSIVIGLIFYSLFKG